jgi:hypothetical protein
MRIFLKQEPLIEGMVPDNTNHVNGTVRRVAYSGNSITFLVEGQEDILFLMKGTTPPLLNGWHVSGYVCKDAQLGDPKKGFEIVEMNCHEQEGGPVAYQYERDPFG